MDPDTAPFCPLLLKKLIAEDVELEAQSSARVRVAMSIESTLEISLEAAQALIDANSM